MKMHRLAGVLFACLLNAAGSTAQDAPLFRLFLKDGSSLVSFGEMARVDDRVVFSMPTSPGATNPELHLVTIPEGQVDWDKTTRYSESARASRYLASRAEADYALLTTDIAQALNDVVLTTVPRERLAVVQRARKTLADWPGHHFGYKQDEVHQMLGSLDEAIAELRAASGAQQFDLAFVAATESTPERVPLMPAPTLQESIEQTLLAATLTPSSDERMSLLTVANAAIDRDAAFLPSDWMTTTRERTTAAIAREVEIDRAYQSFNARMLKLADTRARAANVRGVERLVAQIKAQDDTLGRSRPDIVNSLLASVDQQLDAARRFRLQRDRWVMRLPELRQYEASVQSVIDRLTALKPSLENIKALAGSSSGSLDALQATARRAMRSLAIIPAPEECRDLHALLASAAQLADSAAVIRREAVLASSLPRAWDASSAAAGSMMLTARARAEIVTVLQQPQFTR